MADIFISHEKCANYKVAFKLKYDEIITILKNCFK